MKVWTIISGDVLPGAEVSAHTMASGVEIPVIAVGEVGRGRKRDFVVVHGVAVGSHLWSCDLTTTRRGAPKLVAPPNDDDDQALIVDLTVPGFRGGIRRTGDVVGWRCHPCGAGTDNPWDKGEDIEHTDRCSLPRPSPDPVFAPLLHRVLAEGYVAQGAAGRAGGGAQVIWVVPAGAVWRVQRTGRLYGAPANYYYHWTGSALQVATWQDRAATDIF